MSYSSMGLTLAAALFASSLSAGPATPATEPANLHYARGLKSYDAGDYPLALREFQAAYALRPSCRLEFNIAQLQYRLAQYAKARQVLQQYLRNCVDGAEAEQRLQVEQELQELTARTVELSVQVNVDGAAVSIDGVSVGAAPFSERLLVDAGAHSVQATKPGYSPATYRLVSAGGEIVPVWLRLWELAPQTAGDESFRARHWAWLGSAVLVAGALGTGLATVWASHRYEQMRAHPQPGSAASARAALDRQRSLVSALATSSDVLGVAAGATAGVALYLSFSSPAPIAPVQAAGATPELLRGVSARLEF